jgi:hypothetical protein
MTIAFKCECGRTFRTADEFAGRKTTCPVCGVQITVPAPEGVAHAAPPPLPSPGAAQRWAPVDEAPPAPGYDRQSEEVAPIPRRPAAAPPRRSEFDGIDRDDGRGPGLSRTVNNRDFDRFRKPAPASSGWTDKGVLAGIAMMIGAIVWFFGAGLLFDLWFFYPPILFIVGLVCFIKGLATGRS